MSDPPLPDDLGREYYINEYFTGDEPPTQSDVGSVKEAVVEHCKNSEATIVEYRLLEAAIRSFALSVLGGEVPEPLVKELIDNICEDLGKPKDRLRNVYDDHITDLKMQSGEDELPLIEVIEEECTQCTRVISKDATAEEEWHWTFEHDGEAFHFVTNGRSHKDPDALRSLYNRRVALDDQHDGPYVETGEWNDAITDWTKENADENRVPGPATRALNYVKNHVAAATEYGELADAAELGGVFTTSYEHPESGESVEEIWIPNDVTSRAASNADIHINKLVSEVMSRGVESDALDEGVNHNEEIDGEGSGTDIQTFWRFDAQHFPDPNEYRATADTVDDLMSQSGLPGESAVPDGGTEPSDDTDDSEDENEEKEDEQGGDNE